MWNMTSCSLVADSKAFVKKNAYSLYVEKLQNMSLLIWNMKFS